MDNKVLNELDDIDYNEAMFSRNIPLTNNQPQQKEDEKHVGEEKEHEPTYYDLHDYIT